MKRRKSGEESWGEAAGRGDEGRGEMNVSLS